eukprot:TRINITY_DN18263_c0_g1_i1.p1 TRINITY_DN18263_c0_g1~~TRINITY_DN18263_c0_g1_i1.p1  ORF type:complete len:840 (-),score=90.09 TRINITY_DN18263_c0_g1_i1:811-3330(-)
MVFAWEAGEIPMSPSDVFSLHTPLFSAPSPGAFLDSIVDTDKGELFFFESDSSKGYDQTPGDKGAAEPGTSSLHVAKGVDGCYFDALQKNQHNVANPNVNEAIMAQSEERRDAKIDNKFLSSTEDFSWEELLESSARGIGQAHSMTGPITAEICPAKPTEPETCPAVMPETPLSERGDTMQASCILQQKPSLLEQRLRALVKVSVKQGKGSSLKLAEGKGIKGRCGEQAQLAQLRTGAGETSSLSVQTRGPPGLLHASSLESVQTALKFGPLNVAAGVEKEVFVYGDQTGVPSEGVFHASAGPAGQRRGGDTHVPLARSNRETDAAFGSDSRLESSGSWKYADPRTAFPVDIAANEASVFDGEHNGMRVPSGRSWNSRIDGGTTDHFSNNTGVSPSDETALANVNGLFKDSSRGMSSSSGELLSPGSFNAVKLSQAGPGTRFAPSKEVRDYDTNYSTDGQVMWLPSEDDEKNEACELQGSNCSKKRKAGPSEHIQCSFSFGSSPSLDEQPQTADEERLLFDDRLNSVECDSRKVVAFTSVLNTPITVSSASSGSGRWHPWIKASSTSSIRKVKDFSQLLMRAQPSISIGRRLPLEPPRQVAYTRLMGFAEALASHDEERTRFVGDLLRPRADPCGDHVERLTHYVLRALELRKRGEGPTLPSNIGTACWSERKDMQLGPMTALAEMQHHLPFVPFMKLASVKFILDAVEDESHFHLVDSFYKDIGQYAVFFQALGVRPGGPPAVKLTLLHFDDGSLSKTAAPVPERLRLQQLADGAGVPFECRIVQCSLMDFDPAMVELVPGEPLVISLGLSLQSLPDSFGLRSNPKEKVLRTSSHCCN